MSDFSILPSNVKLFVEALLGAESPITEGDFSESDLNALRSTVTKARQRGDGTVSYGDYPSGLNTEGWGATIKDSFNDPGYRAMTSVGMGNHSLDSEGNTIVTDTYNFNASDKADKLSAWEKTKLLAEALRDPLELGNVMGNLAGGQRPTRINLGRVE